VAFRRLSSTVRWAALVAPCAGFVFGGCGGEYDDCQASKTCPTGGTSGAGGKGSGAGSGRGGVGAAGQGASDSGGSANTFGGGAGSAAQSGNGGGMSAGQSGEAGSGGAGEGGGALTGGTAGTGETGGEGGTETQPLPDTEPPHVVEVSPEDGAVGVRADADIVVTFSEPMNRVETEKAYSSLELPTKNVTFSWSNGDRRLTIHPDDGLEYGAWTLASATNHDQIYTYVIGRTARDVAGNRLEADWTASFTMLREYWQQLTRVGVHQVLSGGTVSAVCVKGTTTSTGDTATQEGSGLLVTFSTGGVDWLDESTDLLRADLTLERTTLTSFLGPLRVDRVREDPATATWATPVLEQLVLTGADPSWMADARHAVLADLAERTDDLTQYFVHHELMTNNDGAAQSSEFACSAMSLRVSYLGL
jgi:hypothetical protein